jgi:hypothetical protein
MNRNKRRALATVRAVSFLANVSRVHVWEVMIPRSTSYKLVIDGRAVAIGSKRDMRKARTRQGGRIEYATPADATQFQAQAANPSRAGVLIT